jgi:hypothetical protein
LKAWRAKLDEDERGQAERVDGREAECVVDRGADVAVGGGEERRRSENALELDLPASAAGHRRSLERENDEGPACAGPSLPTGVTAYGVFW